jgi:hypothetical protein
MTHAAVFSGVRTTVPWLPDCRRVAFDASQDSSKDSSSACCCCLPSAQRKEDGTEPDARAVQQELDPAPIIAAFNRFDADGTGSLDKSEAS